MTEAEIIKELRYIDGALSPENLWWDSERCPADAYKEERELTAARAKLVKGKLHTP